jgi:NAD(P)-dependent dehydrogenase (short-subunit alcohol dehydrogenase family)
VDCEVDAVARACEVHGPVDALVHAAVDVGEPAAAASLDPEQWQELTERPVLAMARACTAFRAHVLERGGRGRIVLVLPAISQLGAAGLVALTTTLEAQRTLAKSLARRWGADGITVNCVAPALTCLRAGPESAGHDLHRAALPGADSARSAAEVVAAFLEGLAEHVTGQTIAADGGLWMP